MKSLPDENPFPCYGLLCKDFIHSHIWAIELFFTYKLRL